MERGIVMTASMSTPCNDSTKGQPRDHMHMRGVSQEVGVMREERRRSATDTHSARVSGG